MFAQSCIIFSLISVLLTGPLSEDYGDGDPPEVFLNEYQVENLGSFPSNADNSSLRRLQITEYLKEQGCRWPPHARRNSKA